MILEGLLFLVWHGTDLKGVWRQDNLIFQKCVVALPKRVIMIIPARKVKHSRRVCVCIQ